MKFGFRKPSLKRRISARTSIKRQVIALLEEAIADKLEKDWKEAIELNLIHDNLLRYSTIEQLKKRKHRTKKILRKKGVR